MPTAKAATVLSSPNSSPESRSPKPKLGTKPALSLEARKKALVIWANSPQSAVSTIQHHQEVSPLLVALLKHIHAEGGAPQELGGGYPKKKKKKKRGFWLIIGLKKHSYVYNT